MTRVKICTNCGKKLGIFVTEYQRKLFCGFDCMAEFKHELVQAKRSVS